MKNLLNRNGMSLYEVVLASAIFALTATMFAGAYVVATQSRSFAANQDRAAFLAEEGLEATRNIRDASFTALTAGTWGLATSTGHWTLSGSSDTTGIFKRQIIISKINTTTDQVVSSINWPAGKGDTATILLTTNVINFTSPLQASCLLINTGSSTIGGTGNLDLLGITLGNSCAGTITPTAVTVSWTPTADALTSIKINGATAWTGSDNSGGTIPISGFAISMGTSTIPINSLGFTKSMTGNTFTIIFTMNDGSTETVRLSPP
jgi:hypothetical protein